MAVIMSNNLIFSIFTSKLQIYKNKQLYYNVKLKDNIYNLAQICLIKISTGWKNPDVLDEKS